MHAVETGPQADQLLRDVAASGMSVAVQGFALGAAMFTFCESKLIDDLRADGSLDAPFLLRLSDGAETRLHVHRPREIEQRGMETDGIAMAFENDGLRIVEEPLTW